MERALMPPRCLSPEAKIVFAKFIAIRTYRDVRLAPVTPLHTFTRTNRTLQQWISVWCPLVESVCLVSKLRICFTEFKRPYLGLCWSDALREAGGHAGPIHQLTAQFVVVCQNEDAGLAAEAKAEATAAAVAAITRTDAAARSAGRYLERDSSVNSHSATGDDATGVVERCAKVRLSDGQLDVQHHAAGVDPQHCLLPRWGGSVGWSDC